jgi:restriction system protein
MANEQVMWGIHMGRQHELRPIEQGYVAIGWSKVGDLSKLPKDRTAFKSAVQNSYPNYSPGAVPVIAGTLYRFANEMNEGDLIIFPSKPNRTVNIGTISGPYTYDISSDQAFPNRRKIKWLKHIPRAEFSQNALHEIGSAVTLFQVKNNFEEFLAAIEGKPLLSVDVDEETATIATESTEESTTDFVLKRLKSRLDPYQFESFVAHLLEKIGYYARVTAKSGDSGVDIIAHKDVLGFEPPIVKVQCKQIFNNVGQPDVAQLYGHIQQGEFGLFVTLGEYTSQARHFERGKHNLRLISGNELVELIFEHYDQFEPKYQMLLPMKKIYIPGALSMDGGEPMES